MTNDRFMDIVRTATESRLSMGERKGREYANSEDDRLANFKKVGKELGIPPEAVLIVYSTKHWLSINAFVRDLAAGKSIADIETGLTESIDGRIDDLQNYLDLLRGLIVERREKQPHDL